MSIEVSENKSWIVFLLKDRIDDSNYKEFTFEMDKRLQEKTCPNIALQMSGTQFLSLPSIKYFSVVAKEIAKKGGKLALVGVSEKLKRQIDIFATLKPMLVFRSEEDWENFTL